MPRSACGPRSQQCRISSRHSLARCCSVRAARARARARTGDASTAGTCTRLLSSAFGPKAPARRQALCYEEQVLVEPGRLFFRPPSAPPSPRHRRLRFRGNGRCSRVWCDRARAEQPGGPVLPFMVVSATDPVAAVLVGNLARVPAATLRGRPASHPPTSAGSSSFIRQTRRRLHAWPRCGIPSMLARSKLRLGETLMGGARAGGYWPLGLGRAAEVHWLSARRRLRIARRRPPRQRPLTGKFRGDADRRL